MSSGGREARRQLVADRCVGRAESRTRACRARRCSGRSDRRVRRRRSATWHRRRRPRCGRLPCRRSSRPGHADRESDSTFKQRRYRMRERERRDLTRRLFGRRGRLRQSPMPQAHGSEDSFAHRLPLTSTGHAAAACEDEGRQQERPFASGGWYQAPANQAKDRATMAKTTRKPTQLTTSSRTFSARCTMRNCAGCVERILDGERVDTELVGGRSAVTLAQRRHRRRGTRQISRGDRRLRSAADRLQRKSQHKSHTGLFCRGIARGILFNPVTGPETRRWLKDMLSGGDGDFGDDHVVERRRVTDYAFRDRRSARRSSARAFVVYC